MWCGVAKILPIECLNMCVNVIATAEFTQRGEVVDVFEHIRKIIHPMCMCHFNM